MLSSSDHIDPTSVRIAAVLVVYNEEVFVSITYQTLLQNSVGAWDVMVYDNSPIPISKNLPVEMDYVSDPTNPGVSTAYNYAIDWALKKGSTHLLLLDSDSEFPPEARKAYETQAKKTPNKVLLPTMKAGQNVLSPFYFSYGKSKYGNGIPEGEIQQKNVLGINSGAMIPLNLLTKYHFNNALALDWSDIYFFRQLGNPIPAFKMDLNVKHDLSENAKPEMETALFRYQCYMSGIEIVSKTGIERMLMVFWAALKGIKLGLRYRNLRFLGVFFKKLNG